MSKDPRVQAALDARRARVAAKKKAKAKKPAAAKPAQRTKGITNIIKKRSNQAERVFKQASR